MNFDNIIHFKRKEFDSPDLPGSGENMREDFIIKLDDLRHRCGFPLIVNSGYRTESHNENVGGKKSSAHTKGWAADVSIRTSSQRFKFIKEALEIGFNRIGIGSTYIHIDKDPGLPQNVIWTY